jgi:hypothetical protein
MTWQQLLGATAAVFTLTVPAFGVAQQVIGRGPEIGGCEANCGVTNCCCQDQCVEPEGKSCDTACSLVDARVDGKDTEEATVVMGSYKGPFSTAANGDYVLAGKVTVPKKNVSRSGQTLAISLKWSASAARTTVSRPPVSHAAAVGTGLHYFHMCRVCGGRAGCDATWCIGSGSHVDCQGFEAVTSCDH